MVTARTESNRFTKGRSCLLNLLGFLDEVTARLNKGEMVEVCYLDFSMAFDSAAGA